MLKFGGSVLRSPPATYQPRSTKFIAGIELANEWRWCRAERSTTPAWSRTGARRGSGAHGRLRTHGAACSGRRRRAITNIAGIHARARDYRARRCISPTYCEQAAASGIRSARKLCVLARHALGHDPDAFRVDALDAKSLAQARDSLTENCTLRLVARAWKISHRVFAQLQIEALDTRDPLAQVPPEWNRLVITHRKGCHCGDRRVVVLGRDGRWPVAEALMADLLDFRFAHLALSRPAARTAP